MVVTSQSLNPDITSISDETDITIESSEKNIDLISGDHVSILTTEVKDDTGFQSFNISYSNINNIYGTNLHFNLSEWESLVSGTSKSGNHIGIRDIPASTEAGTWEVRHISISDQAGNNEYFNRPVIYTGGGYNDEPTQSFDDWSIEDLNTLNNLGIYPENLAFNVTGSNNQEPDPKLDLELPIFNNLLLSENSVDVSNGEQAIAVHSDITDQSGFDSFHVSYSNIKDAYGDSLHFNLSEWESLVSGTSKSGQHLGMLEIPVSAESGTWQVSNISIRDQADNHEYFNRPVIYTGGGYNDEPTQSFDDWSIEDLNTLNNLGIYPENLAFNVTGSNNQEPDPKLDLELPIFNNLLLSENSVDVSNGEQAIAVHSDITDQSGFDYFSVSYNNINDIYGTNLHFNLSEWESLVSGTSKSGNHIGIRDIPASTEAGTWEVRHISISDQAGNNEYFNRPVIYTGGGYNDEPTQSFDDWSIEDLNTLNNLGIYPENLAFNVTGSNNQEPDVDNRLPVLSNLSASFLTLNDISSASVSTFDVSNGNSLEIEVELKDLGAGLGQARMNQNVSSGSGYFESIGGGSSEDQIQYVGNLTFVGPGSQYFDLSLNSDDLISGDLNHGVFSKSISISSAAEPGTWRLADYYLSDQAGNYSNLPGSLRIDRWSNDSDSEEIRTLKTELLADALGINEDSLTTTILNSSYSPAALNDEIAPQLININHDKSLIDVSTEQQQITFDIELKDLGAGLGQARMNQNVSSGSGYFESIGGGSSEDQIQYVGNLTFVGPGSQYFDLSLNSDDLISGDLNHGVFSKSISISSAAEPGTWRLADYYLSDQAGNYSNLPGSLRIDRWSNDSDSEEIRTLKTELLADALGINEDSLTTTILNSSYSPAALNDEIAPQLININHDKSLIDVSTEQQQITFDIELKDLGAGLGQARMNQNVSSGSGYFESIGGGSSEDQIQYVGNLTFVGPGSQYFDLSLNSDDLISGDLNHGVFSKSISISSAAEPGTWRLADYYLSDQAGNYSNLPGSLRIDRWSNDSDSEEIRTLKTELLADALGINEDSLTTTILNSSYSPAELNDETGPELLRIRFLNSLSEIDKNSLIQFGYHLSSDDGIAPKQQAVLGDSVNHSAKYNLQITAQSLDYQYNIESTDITIAFDPQLFGAINASDIKIGGELPIANAVQIDNQAGTIRLAASSLSDLGAGQGISSSTPLASISLDFDESQIALLEKNNDGSLKINPLAFQISANQQETVFSKSFTDTDTGLLNREILTLADLGGGVAVDGQDVTLYEAKINLEQQGDGLVLGTDRVIGSDATFTNLVRQGDTLSTSSQWLNVGNIEASNLSYTELYNQNASIASAEFSQSTVASGSFIDGAFVQDARESTTLNTEIKVTGQAGQVVDLSDGILEISADGSSEVFSNSGKGSSNLITYQGDLNYDGRVSMKDLAYLNAGAARQQTTSENPTGEDLDGNGVVDASVATDVDANFDKEISLADLAVLDQDWGKTLHTGDESFQGSADVSWNDLDQQGTTSSWDNSSFKDQNAIEADSSYVGSLQEPGTSGVIGGNNQDGEDSSDIQGQSFQDPLTV